MISSSSSLNMTRVARTSIDSISKSLDIPNTIVEAGTNGSNLACNKEWNDSCSSEFHDTGRFWCIEVCVLRKRDLNLDGHKSPRRTGAKKSEMPSTRRAPRSIIV